MLKPMTRNGEGLGKYESQEGGTLSDGLGSLYKKMSEIFLTFFPSAEDTGRSVTTQRTDYTGTLTLNHKLQFGEK